MSSEVNNWYNGQNLLVTEGDFEGYNIKFDLSFKDGGSSLQTKIKAVTNQLGNGSFLPSIEQL